MRLATVLVITFFAITFIVCDVSGQTVNPAKVKFRGLGLDSTYAQIVKVLGKPKAEETKDEGCIGAHERYVDYSGVSFYLMDGDSKDRKTFEVKAFNVTSSKYVVSGVKVGDSPAIVKKKYGRKYVVKTDGEPGETIWYYEMSDRDGPGAASVTFKNGKVIQIGSNYQVC